MCQKKKSSINLIFLHRNDSNEGLVLELNAMYHKKNIFHMQANGVVEELCGIWIQKYFISPKTQR